MRQQSKPTAIPREKPRNQEGATFLHRVEGGYDMTNRKHFERNNATVWNGRAKLLLSRGVSSSRHFRLTVHRGSAGASPSQTGLQTVPLTIESDSTRKDKPMSQKSKPAVNRGEKPRNQEGATFFPRVEGLFYSLTHIPESGTTQI